MIRIIKQEQYDLFLAQQGKIEQLQKDNEQLQKENDKLRKENSILNHAIASQNIDFPNSSVRSSDLYDPVDKLF